MIKRSFLLFTVLMMITLLSISLLSSCGSSVPKGQVPSLGEATGHGNGTALADQDAASSASGMTTYSEQTGIHGEGRADESKNQAGGNEQLLQSASVDLNGDGINEQVTAVQISAATESNGSGDIEGRLKIKSGTTETQLTFCKKSTGMTGVMTSIQFEDLDGDGSKDIFIIIPDNGAAFANSKYYIYSYKKNLEYAFTSDLEMADFINGFSFKHKNGNVLTLSNSNFNFSANLDIEYKLDDRSSDEYMSEYEQRAWIEPVPDDMGEDSKLALIKNSAGIQEIKVPLPIFGLATVDLIGEIDLYYSVDSNFKPILKHFDVLDFKGAGKVKVGSCEVK